MLMNKSSILQYEQKQPFADVYQNNVFLKFSQYSQKNNCVGVTF